LRLKPLLLYVRDRAKAFSAMVAPLWVGSEMDSDPGRAL
jgi:hypothetical protein